MDTPGFYYGSHPGCALSNHHRHPMFSPGGERTAQPHEYIVTTKAEITITLSVDTDGTIRLRGGDFDIDQVLTAEIDDRLTGRRAEMDDDLWDRLLDALPRDGEIVVDGSYLWTTIRKEPILDAVEDPIR